MRTHGVSATYLNGCRCDPCRGANSRYTKRLRYDHSKGIYRYVPAQIVARHLRRLNETYTFKQIAELTGIHETPLNKIARGHRSHVQQRTAIAIFSLTPAGKKVGSVPSVGARRRIQALMTLGWSHGEMSARLGYNTRDLFKRQRIAASTATRVSSLYDDLWNVTGPSNIAAGHARTRGYAPPLAWDDETIDDPNAKPVGIKHMYADVHTRIPDTDILVAEVNRSGVTIVAERYGVTPGAINKVLARRGYRAVTRADQGQLPTYMKKVAA